MVKKVISFLIFFFAITVSVKAISLPSEVSITADSMALINLDNDEIIYGKNEDKVQIMASLTKIMTAYVVVNQVNDLGKMMTITETDIANLKGFTCVGLEVGDKVSYQDLLYALILHSAADAAQTLAYHVAGSLEEFKNLMNKAATDIGLHHTHFEDSYGGSDDNVSTAREMAILLRRALEKTAFKKIFESRRYIMSNGLAVVNYTLIQAEFYGFDSTLITGSKSGYTPEAGLLLASTAKINGINYILVVCKSALNEPELTNHVLDSYKVFNYVNSHHYEKRVAIKKGTNLKEIKVVGGTTDSYLALCDEDVEVFLNDEEFKNIKLNYNIVDEISYENKKGDSLGYVDVTLNGEVLNTYYVYLKDDIFAYEKPSKMLVIVIILLVFFIVVLLVLNLLMYHRKK